MAARALEVDAEKRLANVLGELDRHGLTGVDRATPDDAVDETARLVGGRDELPHEPVEGDVGGERAVEPGGDLPPATSDEARARVVVTEEVVPECHPVVGVGHVVVEQVTDKPRVFVGIGVGHERFDPVGLGQQAHEIEARPADEGAVVTPGRPRHAVRRKRGIDDAVDGVRTTVHGRWQHDLAECEWGLPRRALEREAGLPRGLLVDPGLQGGDRLGRQRLAVAWHPIVGIIARDPGHEFAGGRTARNEPGRTGIAPGDEILAGVEREASLPRVAGVALTAVLSQDRHHLVREIDAHGRGAQGGDDHQEPRR